MPIRVTAKRSTVAPNPPSPTRATLPFGLPQPPPQHPQKPPGISLCMIVKNEERFLAQCLRSVAGAVDEIIIVDTGSSDRTIEIARSFGARVIEREWRDDFSWARNESIKDATKRWIMFLDADEELTPESKDALKQLRNAPAYKGAVWVRCFNRADDYLGTGDMSHALVRIFPNDEEIRFRGLIHEFPSCDDSPSGLQAVIAPISIIHHGYLKDVVAERNKGQRNLDIVRAAAEREPNDPFHWFNLGNTAFLVGDFEQARDALEEMFRRNAGAKRGFIPNGYAVLAETYTDKLGDPVRGEQVARQALTVAPHYANAHFQLGKALVAQRRYDEARAAYRDAIADGPYAHLQFVIDDQVYIWKAQCEIGSTYVMQGNDKDAVEWFHKAHDAAPNVQPVMINYARALDRLGRTEEAHAMYKRAYETHHDDIATIDYVNALLRLDKGVQALEVIEESHSRLSDGAAVALLLAAAQIAVKNELPLSEIYLWSAAQRAPGNAEILNPLEAMLRARGDDERLAQLLEREAASLPQSSADYLRRSYQAITRSDFSAARVLSLAGIERAPSDPLLHYNAAIAAVNLELKEEALEHLEFVLPDDGEAYQRCELLRGVVLRELGRLPEAASSLGRLLDVDPSQPDALAARAKVYEELVRYDEAEIDLRRLFAVDSQRGGIELSSYFMRRGRFADAAAIAEQALAG